MSTETPSRPLTLHRCRDCGNVQHGWQDRYCVRCWSRELAEVAARGTASLLSWATYHSDYRIPGISAPYSIGLIRLDEGPQLPCLLAGDTSVASFQQRITVEAGPAGPGNLQPEVTGPLRAIVVRPDG
ncbi:MAG: hypothetical protein GEV12_15455 [Micromonosporaceae bacterium]|nr:hypothetical protein [Micromonosporaceae bacterium]